ncbi:hypothetical protein AB0F59_02430 [Micromonospora lupini]|uniref:GHMP family kinase ATP-binding protein n=1 Tax=Micromonospora lupini TaxID=285679 RepID=UPI0034050557
MFDVAGRRQRALVTLTHSEYGTLALFRPRETPGVAVTDSSLTKAQRAAELALRELGGLPSTPAGGVLEIVSNVPHGVGMGSSTSDVVAAIRAVADYHAVELRQDTVARLAVEAEKASDAIMVPDRVVLFAHRAGTVLETLGTSLPPLVVLGSNAEPGGNVDTLRHPPAQYEESDLAVFGILRAALRRAIEAGDPFLLGRVTTASARLNQRFLPKRRLEDVIELCRRHGGCGVQVAHSGTVMGLLFDARLPDVEEAVQACAAGLERLDLPACTVLRTGHVRQAVRVR